MEPVEILKQARELISDPLRWTKGDYAKNILGEWAGVNKEEAVCWCAEGAILRTVRQLGRDFSVEGIQALHLLEKGVPSELREQYLSNGWSPVPNYNDAPERTHQEILDMFDRAIALGEAT